MNGVRSIEARRPPSSVSDHFPVVAAFLLPTGADDEIALGAAERLLTPDSYGSNDLEH